MSRRIWLPLTVSLSIILILSPIANAVDQFMQENTIRWYKEGDSISCVQSTSGNNLGNVPEPWRSLIVQTAPNYPKSDPQLVAATLFVENRGWPDFNRKDWAVSTAGAMGPWQFIESTWAGMGRDGDGDGVKDPNNPKDAVHSAFIHQEGSAGLPLIEGFTGDIEAGLNLSFKRDRKNLLSFMASYNGSGAPDGTALKDFPANENGTYVLMAYYILASNFTIRYDEKTKSPVSIASDGESVSTAVGGCAGGGAGIVDASGHSFPVGLPKSDVTAGYGLPCTGTMCHHDNTPALDIAHKNTVKGTDYKSTVGVPVYAISNGTIAYSRSGYGGYSDCYSIGFTADDGWKYWYGHIAKPKVKSGQKVSAGQQIAEIGRQACTGNGSWPHLHLDRGSPKGQSGGRVSARDSGFIQLINQLYENLPD